MTNPKLILREWDSTFFSRSIYGLDWTHEVSEKDINLNVDDALIVDKVVSDNYSRIDFLLSENFKLVESEINFVRFVEDKELSSNSERIMHAEIKDLTEVTKIVENAYNFSRFRAPWFNEEEQNKLYSTWLSKAILGEFDDFCLIYRTDEGSIAGFVTLKIDADNATIGLIAVSRQFSRQGIGHSLLAAVNNYCIENNLSYINVATQISNVAAINFYLDSGYKVSSTFYWFYK
ncbi:dTDP-4-amino-4,6-dideoxy-D-galactose acyltransferase [Shewanella algae]|uniref:dTDP-4-amino-4,6-dideoxy-D-galactose acyltransferase n=1 Tax=Shewanella algae TaxID=38313 RepID=UPI000E3E8F8D|nr:dTDP-4-amino-4,6-dideoxy-D-galactose acyltransferase [Shewanella algae]QXP18249.1 dTDP-4-amino-4,6-dideoxy-D-galactose acyltransferase [Shewanella algae]QXP31538.1 dTDP-4-amino-4,6-dideoxy-D-galactose acyltransferase [Shewanella algae]QXP35203.1 dTDP-4-amino-4,6-dideoxy-D-galactose acyltransferase [Shewanella algae]QXP36985.1 dTDP-4-amino-4,6-dideoxy-D-galactose acyltransferase [Shewanella algae]UYA15528.1 dTDP-4-amino-4,6-dideoxy-D-galactose acyltransferase [Shewanella algae]